MPCRAGGEAGLIYIDTKTAPSKADLEELVRLGQGKVTQTSRGIKSVLITLTFLDIKSYNLKLCASLMTY